MNTLKGITWMSTSTKSSAFQSLPPLPCLPTPLLKKNPPTFCVLRATSNPVSEVVEEDVLQMFLRERQLNGDFISRALDKFWLREVVDFVDAEAGGLAGSSQEREPLVQSEDDDGFLKLSRTREWLSGDNPAPMNKKASAKVLQDDSNRRKKLNFLKYEALKRELMLVSVGIGTACTGYCLIVLSLQAAISYAIGVSFRIGIRSEDLRDSLEKSIRGSSIALSSPRLVIPAAIYGFWALSHHYFTNDLIDFQLVPAMFGMFVYKAAALVQVYRDNEDLQFVFPENEGERK